MRGHVRMVVQNRLSDLIRSEVGSANPRKVMVAGTLLTGVMLASTINITIPKPAVAGWCPPGWSECGPEWKGLCCNVDAGQSCCWGEWCDTECGSCPPGQYLCGPEWQGLCCDNDQACCWGSWCTWGNC